jgi:predicted dehydrogenase
MSGSGLVVYTEHSGRIVDISPKYPEKVNTFEVQIRKFLAAIRGEGKPAATFEQGLTMMKVLDAMYASSKAGREVAVQA